MVRGRQHRDGLRPGGRGHPIQEAQAYATFADHGIQHLPEVASAIVRPDGTVVKTFAPSRPAR